MADSKITALTSISTSTDPANDPLVIVDVSDTSMAATGTTKKVTLNNLLACSPTATLASATITGNLTLSAGTANGVGYLNGSKVFTAGSALVFDGTNLGVGGTGQLRFATSGGTIGDNYIGTENSFNMKLHCGRGSTSSIEIASDKLLFYTSASERYRIANDGVATWSNVGGVAGTAMTLNATGLGVGRTPISKLTVDKASQTPGGTTPNGALVITDTVGSNLALEFGVNSAALPWIQSRNSTTNTYYDLLLNPNGGNVGIGVTPITSHILSSAGPIGISGTNSGTRTSYISNSAACSIYYTDGGGSGFFADFGNLIIQPRTSAGRSVVIATSAAAGTPVERLIVDPNGNLGIGVTPSATMKLDVQGQSIRLNSGSATGFALLRLGGTASDSFFGFAGNANDIVTGTSAGDTVIGSNKAGANLRFISGNGSLNATLDASGNLLVGKTASSSTVVGAELRPSGAIISTLAASTNSDFALYTYSTGAGAARFYVGMSGTVFATNTTISAISDARLKENVQDIDVGLGAILALKPRKFDWKAGKGKDIKGDRGFIAQEFEQVFPQLVDEWADPSPEGEAPYKSVRQDLIPVLVKAIQELAAEVNALKNA